jgi:hypothetical protein
MIPSSAPGRDFTARFDDYATKYQTVRMERRDGILQMTFHTGGGPLQWGLVPHGEFPQAFRDVGSDPDSKVVIITGTGDTYSGPRAAGGTGMRSTPAQWDRVFTQPLKRQLIDYLGHGLALEGMSVVDRTVTPGP